MNYKQNNICIKKLSSNFFRHRIRIINTLFIFLTIFSFTSCSDFVEVDPPKNLLISETVFNDPSTVESVLASIYYKIREHGIVSGRSGLTTLLGIYSDELDYYGFDINSAELYNHNIVASNSLLQGWWSNAYNVIYTANDIIAGIENSNSLTIDDKERFKGQALFVRAYIHSLLSNVYGDIPYITTTNYLENNSVARLPASIVMDNIISDLISAVTLLENTPVSGERVLPSQSVAKALLARMYLYTENWELAETVSSELIDMHTLELDINSVFLKESSETLWQLKPGDSPRNTHEANELIIHAIPEQRFALNNNLLDAFELGDLRLNNWIGSTTSTDGTITLHFANKYKATFIETESLEYSIIFRLSEQYLIRAEARAKLSNISGAQQDLNAVRNRAGLPNTTANTSNDLLDAILQERRIELFAEHGHRWLDLKRTGKARAVLSLLKPNWQETHLLFPIPESELEINPNLLPQNSGY